jgi:hypothetical protein
MYFLNAQRTLCHIIEDIRSGEAPDPCGSKVHRAHLQRYLNGKPSHVVVEKPPNVPLCKHCEKGEGGRVGSRLNTASRNANQLA